MQNDEIEQLLIQLEYFIEENYKYYNDFELNKNQIKQLLDYITNLQQENERLKKALNCKEYFSSTMPEDTEFVILTKANYDRQQKDIQFELIDYKSRCEKAVKYMKQHTDKLTKIRVPKLDFNYEDLLNILQNGSDSQ